MNKIVGGKQQLDLPQEYAFKVLEQSLMETIADWLDSEFVTFEMDFADIQDPNKREQTLLHCHMASAAIAVLKAATKH